MDVFKSIWSWLVDMVEGLLDFAVSALPPSPFKLIDNSVIAPYLGWFNWIFPVSEVLVTLEVWLVAVGIFYAIQALLRWVKAIE